LKDATNLCCNILKAMGDNQDFRVMVLPDHATPIEIKTHTADTIFFGMFGKGIKKAEFQAYSEKEAQKSQMIFEKGHELMEYFIKHMD